MGTRPVVDNTLVVGGSPLVGDILPVEGSLAAGSPEEGSHPVGGSLAVGNLEEGNSWVPQDSLADNRLAAAERTPLAACHPVCTHAVCCTLVGFPALCQDRHPC